MTYAIAEPCVDLMDRACVAEPPVDCIYEGKRTLYIHPDECVDCGAGEPVCPVDAIYYSDELPVEYREFAEADAGFFDTVGSAGGAARRGRVARDAGVVALLSAR